jgi:hypothetical protein
MGALLQHHSLQSTKYLSKWIEEKGKWFCVVGCQCRWFKDWKIEGLKDFD